MGFGSCPYGFDGETHSDIFKLKKKLSYLLSCCHIIQFCKWAIVNRQSIQKVKWFVTFCDWSMEYHWSNIQNSKFLDGMSFPFWFDGENIFSWCTILIIPTDFNWKKICCNYSGTVPNPYLFNYFYLHIYVLYTPYTYTVQYILSLPYPYFSYHTCTYTYIDPMLKHQYLPYTTSTYTYQGFIVPT